MTAPPAPTPQAPSPRVLVSEPVAPKLESLIRDADARADRWFDGRKAPGLIYGVLVDGRLVHARGLGTLRVGAEAPPDLESAFRIASITKSFTAATVLLLRDDGRLALDDPAERYVPELASWRYPTADSPRITIRHLLTMTAGLPSDDPWGDRQQGLDLASFSELLRGGLSFAFTPGTRFEYSNLGYGILGRVITNVAGREYREVVRERLLQPLGMAATGYLAEEVPPERLAHGYVWRDDNGFLEEPMDGYGALASMGGVFTTLPDLARWVSGFVDAWPPRDDPDDGHPLPRAVRREMQQPIMPFALATLRTSAEVPTVESIHYGYGLFIVEDFRIGRTISHSGGYPGFGSQMRWHPASGLAVVGMANGRYAPVTPLLREMLTELIVGEAAPSRRIGPADATTAARSAVEALLARWDDATAAALFAMNVELDEPIEDRRRALDKLRADHGRLVPDPDLQARSESPFHLEWWLRGERGRVRVEILLSPELPPRVQALNLYSVPDPSPELAAAAARIVQALGPDDGAAPVIPAELPLAEAVDRAALGRALRATEARFGGLTLGPAIAGDGVKAATYRLTGEQGSVELAIEWSSEANALSSVGLLPVRQSSVDLE
ncbi:MAG TPA: serine hydrolase domain-containing protein [Candidatus Deferrimicrobiaceae bacterium]|nr:serine hydrolase domain-containing protein [Candidatus Deferrimicrobiaceae bacterium]